MILGLCDRFGCTPAVAADLDASVIRMLKVATLGRPPENAEEG